MANNFTYKKSRHSSYFFLFSIICHIIFLIFMLLSYLKHEKSAQPSHFVPSYAYTSSSAAPKFSPQMARKSIRKTPPDVIGLKASSDSPAKQENKTILSNSLEVLQKDFVTKVANQKKAEPVYLIGDPNFPATGIILLMAKSLSAHFAYPPIAAQLGTTGRVIIAVTLHPSGSFSDIEMLESSHSRELDSAALYAVNSAPLVEGADRFLSAPRRFVIGYLFRSI